MSLKRKIQRGALRLATEDEAAFRATLATVEYFRRLRFTDIQVGFFAAPGKTALSPAVVVHGKKATGDGEAAFTYRLDNFVLTGEQAMCERRWREWVIALVGERPDVAGETMAAVLKESFLRDERVRAALTKAISAAGLVVPGLVLHATSDKGEVCK